jgi:hypothetical protein
MLTLARRGIAKRLADVLTARDLSQVFAEASQALFGKRPEELFGIHKTQVAADSDTMLYFIRLADHAPKPAVVRDRGIAFRSSRAS